MMQAILSLILWPTQTVHYKTARTEEIRQTWRCRVHVFNIILMDITSNKLPQKVTASEVRWQSA